MSTRRALHGWIAASRHPAVWGLSPWSTGAFTAGPYSWSPPCSWGESPPWSFVRRQGHEAAKIGALSVAVALGSFLILGLEGLICIGMTLPLAVPLGALGSWLVYRAEPSRSSTRGGIAILLLMPPASFTWDITARPPVFEVRSSITIAASPERVWKYVVDLPGVARAARVVLSRGAGVSEAGPDRGIRRGRGALLRVLHRPVRGTDRSVGRATAAAIPRYREPGADARVEPIRPGGAQTFAWVHGFQARPVSPHAIVRQPTLLEGTSWYQHGLWPAEYWRWWSDAIIHRIHMRVLNHIRTLAEADGKLP